MEDDLQLALEHLAQALRLTTQEYLDMGVEMCPILTTYEDGELKSQVIPLTEFYLPLTSAVETAKE